MGLQIVPKSDAWALKSPAAELLIFAYVLFMIVSAAVTIDAYVREKVQNNLMKICLILNSIYGAVGIAVFCIMAAQKFST